MNNKRLMVAIGIDCDPDREEYPDKFLFKGIESLPILLDKLNKNVKLTLNIRADRQIKQRTGKVEHCLTEYSDIWKEGERRGHELAWHLHYYDKDGLTQDVSEENILENIEMGSDCHDFKTVHMGWVFQNDFSIQRLHKVGTETDYSCVPRMEYAGRNGCDFYDWSNFAYRPQLWNQVKIVPTYTCKNKLLQKRFNTKRSFLSMATHPILYNRLLKDFFKTGFDFFVGYLHADELLSKTGDWRKNIYALNHLEKNILNLEKLSKNENLKIEYHTIHSLSKELFA